jgi:hypothetical protein
MKTLIFIIWKLYHCAKQFLKLILYHCAKQFL